MQDISDWARLKPWSESVSARMTNYVWGERRIPCPEGKTNYVSTEACAPRDEAAPGGCASADLSGDEEASEAACAAAGDCSYTADSGCFYSLLSDEPGDEKWTTKASNLNFDLIVPESHPANYLLSVAYYAAWLVLQAIFSFFGALLSFCCMSKKQPSEKQPSFAVMWLARAVLGSCMLAVIVMGNLLEINGNRHFNTAVHHAIHAVEGLTNYADDLIGPGGVASGFIGVGDDVLAQAVLVNGTIFGSADPAALNASATCMEGIGADECDAMDTDLILGTYFEFVPADGGPTAGQQASGGSCDVAQYTEGTDYRLASDLGASSLLDSQIAALPAESRCIARCLLALPGCTGAQFSADGTTEPCVLWLNDRCADTSSDGYATVTTAALAAAPESSPLIYRRISQTSAEQADCITSTVTLLAEIDANIMALPAEVADAVVVLEAFAANGVDLCLLGSEMPNTIATSLQALVEPLNEMAQQLGEQLTMATDTLANARLALAYARSSYQAFLDPPAEGDWGVTMDANGEPYGDEAVDATCTGAWFCWLNEEGTDCAFSSSTSSSSSASRVSPYGRRALADACSYTPPTTRPHRCMSLACIDNEFDYYDENLQAINEALPAVSRTYIFSQVSMVAMGVK